MAVFDYPTVGYARWHAWRAYSSAESPHLESELAPAALPVPVRPQGVLLWRGEFETPVYGRRDAAWTTMRTFMERIDHGIHQIRLPVPHDQRRAGVLGATIVAQPTRVDAPTRLSRGQESGWRVQWWEVP